MDKAPDAFRTISEVADDLDVPQHVLRFWETRFPQIKPMKRGGGRRYYRPDDVDLLRGIRHLLYGEGYTIRGVQRLLKDNGQKFVQAVWRPGASPVGPPPADESESIAAGVPTDEEAVPPARPRPAEPIDRSAQPRFTPVAPVAEESAQDSAAPARIGAGETQRPSAVKPIPPFEPAELASAARLSAEDGRRLRAVLDELGECRRLLDAALKDE